MCLTHSRKHTSHFLSRDETWIWRPVTWRTCLAVPASPITGLLSFSFLSEVSNLLVMTSDREPVPQRQPQVSQLSFHRILKEEIVQVQPYASTLYTINCNLTCPGKLGHVSVWRHPQAKVTRGYLLPCFFSPHHQCGVRCTNWIQIVSRHQRFLSYLSFLGIMFYKLIFRSCRAGVMSVVFPVFFFFFCRYSKSSTFLKTQKGSIVRNRLLTGLSKNTSYYLEAIWKACCHVF